ncbi:ABC transporter substrate-binding protein [Delftia sp. PS-11]|uniref:ABC transporter substrate-binding protein n=1 Tax=Delftia sp. PS-11 TaxID=2767222 RepID=UPI002455AA2C|nr:ABC transporter substrate-binding protein [Delftia sp. PS-11]KAJ8744943.1 ABC transporter substrate-binding protein [Delftia sp. PS-11]
MSNPLALLGSTRRRLLVSLLLVTALSACNQDSEESLQQSRHERRARVMADYAAGKDYHLGVVWDTRWPGFINGAQLAAQEYNAEVAAQDERARAEALANGQPVPPPGRRLVLDLTDERPFIDSTAVHRTRDEGRYRNALGEAGVQIAKKVLSNPHISAVVGHMNTEATMPSMLTYQKHGVLLLSGNATDSRLEWMSSSDLSDAFGLYFQLRPSDEVLAQRFAQAFADRGWSKVYFAYENTHGNESLVHLLTSEFAKLGLKISGSLAFRSGGDLSQFKSRKFRSHFTELGTSDVDAIVLLTSARDGAEVIRNSRGIGVLQPFVGMGNLQFQDFIDRVGASGENTLVTTLYRQDNFVVRRFAERFSQRFPDVPPDETAAMGYDSVRLYIEAVARADTVDPAAVSHALRYDLPVVYGVLGSYVLRNGRSNALNYHMRRLSKVPGQKSLAYVDAD